MISPGFAWKSSPKRHTHLTTKRRKHGQIRLFFWRRKSRREGAVEEPARRERRRSCRDGQPRHPRAPRLHHHHGSLHVLLPARDAAPRGAEGRGPREPEGGGRADGHAVRRPQEPAPSVDQIGGEGEHARHDGYGPQPRPQRGDGERDRRADGERVVRLGLLSPLRRHVRRRGARAETREQGRGGPLRGAHR